MEPSDAELASALAGVRTIAVVGLSDKPERDSHEVARYLQEQGYRIVPVNPTVPEVLGERSYPSLEAIPADVRIDLVDVFRRSDQVPPVVESALRRGVKLIWMQLGVEHAASAEAARAQGATVIENRCLRVEHRRLRIPPVGRGD